MSIKNFQIYDADCCGGSPCLHFGKIEKVDGSFYPGLISSDISNAIISNISLKCLQILPERAQFRHDQDPGTDDARKLKFLSHIYFYQPDKAKPLSEVLQEFVFQKPVVEKNVKFSGLPLIELQKALENASFCNNQLSTSDQAFSQAPRVHIKLISIKHKITQYVNDNQVSEEDIRAAAPYLAQIESLAHQLSRNYNDHVYIKHVAKLKKQSAKIRAALESKSVTPEVVATLSRKSGKFFHNINKRDKKLLFTIPGTSSSFQYQELNAVEQQAYQIWKQLQEYLKEAKKQSLQQPAPETNPEKQVCTHEIPQDYICPLSHDIMKDPVITANGTTCENAAILKWLSTNATCPFSTEPLIPAQLVPNRVLKNLIDKWQQQSVQLSSKSKTNKKFPAILEITHSYDEKLRSALNEFKNVFEGLHTKASRANPITSEETNQLISAMQKLESRIEGDFSNDLWQETVDLLAKAQRLLDLYIYKQN